MIILIGGEKGGSGKTTLATNLCAALKAAGRDVLLLDADGQGSASRWADRRSESDLEPIPAVQKSGKIRGHVADLAGRYDDIVIDAGGRDSVELRSAMTVCHLALLPLRPSQLDLETIPHIHNLIESADAMRNDPIDARIVLAQCPTHHLVTEATDARDAIEGLNISLCRSLIRERKIYRDAIIQGAGVVDLGQSPAADEINALMKEIE